MYNSSKNRILFLFTLNLSFLIYRVSAADYIYVPLDRIHLDCGTETKDTGDKIWLSNFGSKYAASDLTKSESKEASYKIISVADVPYMTARIFRSEFTYSFPVGAGWKFVRIHFHSSMYGYLSESNAIFSVSSGAYTLLKDFSVPSQAREDQTYGTVVKEFSVNVDKGRLNITFSPSSNHTDYYALVNGIEVMSMPDIYSSANGSAIIAGEKGVYLIINHTTVLENVVRLNVGGENISPATDTGLSRSWSDDSPYLFDTSNLKESANASLQIKYLSSILPYVAPESIYRTARTMGGNQLTNKLGNLSWQFPVDPGFHYLVRLHFCEFDSDIIKVNQRVFQIFLNNQIVEHQADIVAWDGSFGNGIALYKDYAVRVPKGEGKQDLLVELHPNIATKSQYYDAILNGLEIFKVNDTTGNLAGPNPIPALSKSGKHTAIIAGGIGGVAALCLLCVVIFVVFRRKRQADSGARVRSPLWLMHSLYGTSHPPVSGKMHTTRGCASLEICIGAARGLHYLHTGAKPQTIIHRDVKTTNILLDDKWVAKVSDFGLSKLGPSSDHTHVTTAVKGSFGYMDPEYFRRQQITEKSDVYSLGVVLTHPTLPIEKVCLAEWALHCQRKGIIDQIIDPYLNGKIAPECLKTFAEISEKCLNEKGIDRPPMGDVLWSLEHALQLQENMEGGCGVHGDMDDEEMQFSKDPDAISSGFSGSGNNSWSSGLLPR
ncbi:hypothetical protein C5167_040463 [Papaver somniferum]|uniref:Protein kinase domain-containing protein n=1 Tax=Papaver somniferum TaxID=3469 RepID=A0A4Y7IJ82_PAPSO|nr:hypothetical protein C5167_040463 [Papaver somniferum]